ncbi:MAG: S9 family peptidase, partial [Gammaproteobacteria bacterium]|nr:S9 family peptidase [Gammaproteobacteria bacterium]
VRFHKDGKRVYMTSNKGVDLSRLLLVDVESGEAEVVESDPDAQVDFGSAWFSDSTEELVATVYIGDRVRIYPRTQEFRDEIAWLRAELPDGELGLGSATEDEALALVSVASDRNPGAVYLYDRTEQRLDKLYDSRPELPSDHLAPMRAIRYRARDGVEIPGYLVTPKGTPAENLPTVILPHGGPWGRDYWGYDPFVQFLANRGYAVMQPNFRASTGYGKAFLNAGNGEWGTGVMQHDITDGVKHLVDEGIADPEQVAIMGASYGGYATLAGVAFTPDLYAAGVSIVGPSNIITLLNSIPPYWGPTRQMFMRRVGDPDDEEDRARLTAQSPFFHAENIEAPLLIIQGANDPRVKKAESDQIVVALRDLDRPVQYLLAPDEGHGFAGKENRLAMFAAIERFLARHLDGRYQRQAAPEVSAKLRALRVDLDDVEMPSTDDSEFVEVALDGSALAPVTVTYRITMEMAGQSMSMDTVVERSMTTHNDEEVWRVATTVEFPVGKASDIAFLRVDSLRPVHRAIDQGSVSMRLDFADDAITGSMTMPGGNALDVDIPIEGSVLGHLETALAVMPLEPGLKTRVQAFEPNIQQVQQINIEVVAAGSVETPAGTFDVYELDIASADGTGISGKSWVTQTKPHLAVKSEASLPPMAGGGTMVTEMISVE